MGGLFALCGDSRDLVAEVRGIDVMTRRRTRGATVNDTAAVRGAHQGERGGHWGGGVESGGTSVPRRPAPPPQPSPTMGEGVAAARSRRKPASMNSRVG